MSNDKRDIKIHLVILEGPDGVGKTTLREQLVKRCQDIFGLDLFLTSPYVVINYAAGKNNINCLEPEFWAAHEKIHFAGSVFEADLHRVRYSCQMNKLAHDIAELLIAYPHITNVILIQDRSWISSLIYNAANDYDTAFDHHRNVFSELIATLLNKIQYIGWDDSYIFLTAESPDIIREHKKQRSADDYYEQKFNTEYLFEKYNFWCRQLRNKQLREGLVATGVFQLVNDYRPETIEKFADAFIEDRLK